MRGPERDRERRLSGNELEALRESESRFRSLIELSSDAYWATDENLRFTPTSSERDLAGYPSARNVGRARWELPNATPLSGTWADHEAVMRARKPFRDFEYRRVGTDGAVRYLSISGTPVFDGAGVFRGYQGVGRDVTDRRRAEEALRRSETYLSEALRLGRAGSFALDLRSRIYLHWSSGLYEIFGFDPALGVPTGQQIWDRIHPEDLAWVREQREREIRELRNRDVQYRVIRTDGTLRHIHVVGSYVRDADGTPLEMVGLVMDITGRKAAEAALRESEERFALAVAGTNEGIFDWEVATDRVYMSARAQEMFGLESGEPLRSRREWLELTARRTPGHVERAEQALMAHLRGETPMLLQEFEIVLPDGGRRWIRQRGLGLRDATGRVLRMAGSFEDISERKAIEEALSASEERHALAMKASEAGYWDWNLVTGEYYVSDRLLEMARLSADTSFESRADSLARVPLHPDDKKKWADAVQALFAGKGDRLEMDLRSVFPGEVRWSHLNGMCVRDAGGKVIRWSGSSTDITDRKRAEEELRSRQDMLELAQKAARAVAFDLRMQAVDGSYRWSPELEALYGLAPGTYDGSFKGWKKLVHPDDWPAVRDAMLHANETGDATGEFRVIQPGGDLRWLQAKGRMLFDTDGRPERLVGFMLDVTDRHAAEDELRRLERQLRQAQRLEAMGTLAGGIAHDFNNILGAILGYGEMATRDAPKGSRLSRDLEAIQAAGERGRTLVERILAFSRSGVGERVAVHVERVIREALDLIGAKLPANVTVKASLRSDRAAIQGDATQVHQVLMNLVTNAAQAMTDGGLVHVSVDVRTPAAERVMTTGRIQAREYVVIEVADEGGGIPAGVLERIFDPFFTTKEVGVGTGLGLSIVHGIVAEIGGAIEIATEVGKGSVFTVYVPRSGDAPEVSDDQDDHLPRGSQQRVLVVDDEEPLVQLATRTLVELGYAPAGFTSSIAALEAFRAAPAQFDVVITDERMPGLSGSALIGKMRALRRDIPILLVSGHIGGSIVDRAYNAGADEVLKKPLSARDLATTLARLLQA